MASPEIKAPAGSIEMAEKVLAAGADSVFAGLEDCSRRRYDELTLEELLYTTKLVKKKKKKISVALNAEIPKEEIQGILDLRVKKLAAAGVDGFIVRTPELMRRINEQYRQKDYPGLEIIASVGCNIQTSFQVEKFAEYGITDLVLSTELSRQPFDNERISKLKKLKKTANKHKLKLEMLSALTACIGGVGGGESGGCDSYKYTKSITRKITREHPDGFKRTYFDLFPHQGGGCIRWCNIIFDSEVQKFILNNGGTPKEIKQFIKHRKDKTGNISIIHSHEILDLIKIGIDVIKIQGRENNPRWAADVTKIMRNIVDHPVEAEVAKREKNLKKLKKQWDKTRLEGDMKLLAEFYKKIGKPFPAKYKKNGV